ncbi:MAG: hypothetical protein EOP85_00680 [Verrucomicrobiaceae bacterium]|nr:MAG: hypothetical protein EOP85_00680 [Verrucomicrobiaceae bacterium]
MSRLLTNAISCCLIGSGVVAWACGGRALMADKELDVPLNPLGINGSPYGEVFAMAMQGPIDTYFHGVWSGGSEHKHEEGKACSTCDDASAFKGIEMKSGLQNFLVSLDNVAEVRTNPKPVSQKHRFYLRRQIENKLRFAYNLDPAHYANYNSLHFFLTEPQLGTRPQLTPSAAKLAEETINYCLKRNDDPRPMLTAAAAGTNIIHLMFNDQLNKKPVYTTQQMREYLKVVDHCLDRYVAISRQWDETKNWERLSPQRINECDERFRFISKIRETAEGAIIRFENKSHQTQVLN